MTADNHASGRDPIFSAVLTPHRSLAPGAFLVLMTATGILCFAGGLLFWTLGAWPVTGFFGLDIVLVWVAFRLNYRSARAYEEVFVSSDEILVRKVSARGAAQEFRFNPAWARLAVETIADEGVVRIALRSHGRSLVIGHFLNPEDRGTLAVALGRALAAARAGGSAAL